MKSLYKILIISAVILLGCTEDGVSPDSTGKGGSMARFTIAGDNLYTVSNTSLTLFDISDPRHPQKQNAMEIGWGIETIYPYKDNLFMGSQTGMYIYNISTPSQPKFVSNYQHIFSCDPVVVDGRYAYITLRNGSQCGRGGSRLEVVDINNLSSPQLIKTYDMSSPYGLGVDGANLFVCDEGLKVYDSSDPLSLKLLKHFKINSFDVIPNEGTLMVIGSDGLYQYKYENNDIQLLSKLTMSFND